jgi:hypothetical protein
MIADSVPSAYEVEGHLTQDALTQRLFREAVVEVAERAKSVLPECHDRIEQAVELLLTGEVQWFGDGTVQVRDAEQEDVVYSAEEACTCPESAQAPRGWCVHRLAGAIAKRTRPLVRARLAALSAAAPSESPPSEVDADADGRHARWHGDRPRAPLEADTDAGLDRVDIPPQYIQVINGKPFVRYAGLLAMAHELGLQHLEATFISVTDQLALAQATATFLDGRRFTESSDATPENVHFGVRPHFARLALTRAKARALRDALNISMCAVEELE